MPRPRYGLPEMLSSKVDRAWLTSSLFFSPAFSFFRVSSLQASCALPRVRHNSVLSPRTAVRDRLACFLQTDACRIVANSASCLLVNLPMLLDLFAAHLSWKPVSEKQLEQKLVAQGPPCSAGSDSHCFRRSRPADVSEYTLRSGLPFCRCVFFVTRRCFSSCRSVG